MDFNEIVISRYACKRFNGKKVPDEKISKLIELIRLSPSSFGLQPWKLVVISDQKLLKKLEAESYNQNQIGTCSHLLVFCADIRLEKLCMTFLDEMKKNKVSSVKREQFRLTVLDYLKTKKGDERKEYAQKQVYIAMTTALYGAKSLELDSCPMGGFLPDKYSEILKLPEYLIPTVIVPVGYAADRPNKKIRYENIIWKG